MDHPEKDQFKKEGFQMSDPEAERRIQLLEEEIEKLSGLQKETQTLQSENALLRGRVEKLVQEVNSKNEQIEELFKKWGSSNSHLAIKENEELQRKIEARDEKVEHLESKMQELQNENISRNQKIFDLTIELQQKNSLIADLQKEMGQLKKRNEEQKREINQIFSEEFQRAQKDVRDRELTHFKNQIQELKETSENEQKRLEGVIKDIESSLHEKEKLSESLSQQFNNLHLDHEDLRGKSRDEISKLKVTIAEFETLIQRLRKQIESLGTENSVLIQKHEQMTESLKNEFKGRENIHQNEIQNLEKVILEKKNQVQGLEQRISLLQSEFSSKQDQLRGELSALQLETGKKRDELHHEMKRLESAVQEKEAQIDRLTQQTVLIQKESDEQRAWLESEVKRFQTLSQENEFARRKLESERDALKHELAGQQAILEQEIKRAAHLTQEKEMQIQKMTRESVLTAEKLNFSAAALEKTEKEFVEQMLRVTAIEEELKKNSAAWHEEKESLLSEISRLKADSGKGPKKVLLVEPNEETFKLMQQSLSNGGHRVLAARSSKEVVEIARQERPDLIMMNMVLSDSDGYSVSEQLARDSSAAKIPIVIIASNPEATESFRQNPQSSVKYFLYKPFSIKELLSVVQFVSASPTK